MNTQTTAKFDAENWTMIIRPKRRWLDLRLEELWRYRDLIALFVRRDFVAAHKQTVLGPLWHLVGPLMTLITVTVIFGKIAGLSMYGLPQFLFYMAGTVVSRFIGFVIQLGQFLVFMAYFALVGSTFQPNGWILPTPVLLLIMAGLGLGLGIII